MNSCVLECNFLQSALAKPLLLLDSAKQMKHISKNFLREGVNVSI